MTDVSRIRCQYTYISKRRCSNTAKHATGLCHMHEYKRRFES